MVGELERRQRFGYALQRALRARSLSERQLAKRMGIDPRKVARWRAGGGLPDYYETLTLAEQLGVDEDLFRNPPPVPPDPAYPIEDYLLGAVDEGVVRSLLAEPQAEPGPPELSVPPSRRPSKGRR
jgi:transcriptional regulator with XRE-family HTH domain